MRRNFGLVDLVDEDEARQAHVVQLLEDQLQAGNLLFVGLADDDRRIASRQGRRAHVLAEFN